MAQIAECRRARVPLSPERCLRSVFLSTASSIPSVSTAVADPSPCRRSVVVTPPSSSFLPIPYPPAPAFPLPLPTASPPRRRRIGEAGARGRGKSSNRSPRRRRTRSPGQPPPRPPAPPSCSGQRAGRATCSTLRRRWRPSRYSSIASPFLFFN